MNTPSITIRQSGTLIMEALSHLIHKKRPQFGFLDDRAKVALLISGIKSSSAQRWELTLRNRSHEVNSVYPKKAERERTLSKQSTLCLISPPPPKKKEKTTQARSQTYRNKKITL